MNSYEIEIIVKMTTFLGNKGYNLNFIQRAIETWKNEYINFDGNDFSQTNEQRKSFKNYNLSKKK